MQSENVCSLSIVLPLSRVYVSYGIFNFFMFYICCCCNLYYLSCVIVFVCNEDKNFVFDLQLREYNGSFNSEHGNRTYEPLPEITNCTLDTILVWVPCGFLLLISPLYLYHLLGLKTRGAATWLNISKTVS